MAKFGLKNTILNITLGTFWVFGIVPCAAQVFSTGSPVTDPEVLVSSSNNNTELTPEPAPKAAPEQAPEPIPGSAPESALVDIKAIDAPALHTANGKTGVGSEERFGRGIIIDSNGIIATNRHIIGNARHIYVALSGGKIFEASVLLNSQADLCFLKINAPFPLRAIFLADPSELRIGSKVIAIANPDFNSQRIMGGQVIQIFKNVSSNNTELLEMNIPLKPGDSGGAILNREGSLLGLIMGKQISDPSKSYAIASSRIQLEYFKYRNSILN